MSLENKSSIEGFGGIQVQMNEFTQKFETAIQQTRTRIINEKQQHFMKVNEVRNQENKLRAEIEALRAKETKIKENIKTTMEQLQHQQFKVEELQQKQEQLVREQKALEDEINELSAQRSILVASLEKAKRSLNEQVSRDYAELIKFERYLGLYIEVLGTDRLKFIFRNIDPMNVNKEVWCDLFVGGEKFELGNCNPQLAPETAKAIEDDLNQNKVFVTFLKKIRRTLIDLLTSS